MIELDFETKSYADLKKVGAAVYSEHPTTEVICLCYGIDSQPIQEWWPGKPGVALAEGTPKDLYMAIALGHTVEAHNVAFERSIWENIMVPRHGWVPILPHRWRDSMAVASYYSLPPGLDKLAGVLGFPPKDPEGGRLITKYSKLHLKTAKTEIPPEDFRKFVDYCRTDVLLEQAISDFLGDLPARELTYFKLDQKINSRGLFLDVKGLETASKIVDQRAAILTKEFQGLTGYNPTQRDRCMEWFADQGLHLPNMQADTLETIMEDGDVDGTLPQGDARRALQIRLKINKASTKKLDAMARAVTRNGRAKYQTRYHGTGTGRNSGSGFQPLNMSRGIEAEKLSDGTYWPQPEDLVRDIMYGSAEWLDLVYGDALDVIAKAARHWIMAEPGNRIIAGDLVSIEAVLLSCLAGEDWKIDAFRNGVKIYEHMADKIHNLPAGTVTKATHPSERQDGKTGELAFGYQGALGAWLKFDDSGRHSDERIIEICKAWRAQHPNIVRLWYALEEAAIEAVRTPGRETGYREIGFQIVDDWLSMILPNGKRIWYWKPELRATMPRWHQPLVKPECASGECDCKAKPQLTYMSQKTGQWLRVSTYGGKLTENATQATSREVIMPLALRIEEAGYPVILTVYDEIVTETPENFGSTAEFKQLMLESPGEWARGWPIGVDLWEGQRYRK